MHTKKAQAEVKGIANGLRLILFRTWGWTGAVVLATAMIFGTAAFAQPPAAATFAAPQMPNLDPAAAAAAMPPAPAVPADPFPPVNKKFFTAPTPTVATVDAFLKALWGYDTTRIWRVEAIQKTPAEGVSKVVVFVSQNTPGAKVQSSSFFVLPDGKHAIADATGVMSFGEKPFAENRAILQAKADGAARGSDSKGLLLVEFADLQCPHCKEAQATMDQIVKDFPKARVVFQPYPLVDIHASAFKAAAYGVCVQKQSNDAYFKYAQAVFDTQDALTPDTTDATLKAAVVKAGLDATAMAACADTQATKDVVDADFKLGDEVGVDQTPLLAVNGHLLPLTQIPYEVLKQIIEFQSKQDGVESGATAETLAPKPVVPQLQSLPK